MPTTELKPTYEVIKPTDFVLTTVLHGFHEIPLALPEGTLPTKHENTLAEAREALLQFDRPEWMGGFRADVIEECDRILRDLPLPQSINRERFDLAHRLDDRTLVAAPRNGDTDWLIFTMRPKPEVLADVTGMAFLERLHRWPSAEVGGEFSIGRIPLQVAAPGLVTHVPSLRIIETWRLTSLYLDMQLGCPAGSVALAPGETRQVVIKHTASVQEIEKNTSTVVENASDKTTETFNQEFTRHTTETKGSQAQVTWKNTRTRTSPGSGKTTGSESGGGVTLTSQEVVDITAKTVHNVLTERSRASQVTLTKEFQRTTNVTAEDTRTVNLSNPSASGVTYVYFHVDARYRVNLDLESVELFFNGPDASSAGVPIPLSGGLRARLGPFIKDAAKADAAAQSVASALRTRYGAMGIGTVAADDFTLLKPDPKDTNLILTSRAALTGDRRKAGALPVNLAAEDVMVGTSSLHAVPYLSEFSAPPPASKPAAATP